jgi:hypothetical protein
MLPYLIQLFVEPTLFPRHIPELKPVEQFPDNIFRERLRV